MTIPKRKIDEIREQVGPFWLAQNEIKAYRLIQDARALLRTAPGEEKAEIHGFVGWVYGLLHENARALEEIGAALNFAPNDPGLWMNRGVALSRLGRRDEALDAFLRATDILGEAAWGHLDLVVNLVVELAGVGRGQDALALADQLPRLGPDAPIDALHRMALMEAALGRRKRSVEYFGAALRSQFGLPGDTLDVIDAVDAEVDLRLAASLGEAISYARALRDARCSPRRPDPDAEAAIESERQGVWDELASLRNAVGDSGGR